MCFLCSCYNQLCTSICKSDATISQINGFIKNFTIWKRKRVSAISENEDTTFMYLNSLCCPGMFAKPSFLLNPTRDYYCSFCTLIRIKHVFPFYSCYDISYNITLESFFYEISFYHAMPNYDVMFVVRRIWHCSLFERQQDMSKICYGIPCQTII